jgi:hypothetical protein
MTKRNWIAGVGSAAVLSLSALAASPAHADGAWYYCEALKQVSTSTNYLESGVISEVFQGDPNNSDNYSSQFAKYLRAKYGDGQGSGAYRANKYFQPMGCYEFGSRPDARADWSDFRADYRRKNGNWDPSIESWKPGDLGY